MLFIVDISPLPLLRFRFAISTLRWRFHDLFRVLPPLLSLFSYELHASIGFRGSSLICALMVFLFAFDIAAFWLFFFYSSSIISSFIIDILAIFSSSLMTLDFSTCRLLFSSLFHIFLRGWYCAIFFRYFPMLPVSLCFISSLRHIALPFLFISPSHAFSASIFQLFRYLCYISFRFSPIYAFSWDILSLFMILASSALLPLCWWYFSAFRLCSSPSFAFIFLFPPSPFPLFIFLSSWCFLSASLMISSLRRYIASSPSFFSLPSAWCCIFFLLILYFTMIFSAYMLTFSLAAFLLSFMMLLRHSAIFSSAFYFAPWCFSRLIYFRFLYCSLW